MREVAGPYGSAAVSEAEVDFDGHVLALEVRGDGGFVVVGERQAFARESVGDALLRGGDELGGSDRP